MRPIISLVRCRSGAVAFEFVLVAPALLTLVFAIMLVGIALNNELMLTEAAQQGAQTLSLSRNATTTPYTAAETAITAAAANLTTSKIGQTLTIAGSACASDSACLALLVASNAGKPATVALTYPCDLSFMGLNLGGSPCTLSASSAAVVQ